MSAAAAPVPAAPAREPLVVRSWPERRLRVACAGPLDAEIARDALARQAGLDAPAKLARSADGGVELRAEVPRVHGCDAKTLAERALCDALAWLDGREPERDPDPAAAPSAEELEAALEQLPPAWSFERGEAAGSYRVHATALGASARVQVEARTSATRASVRWAVPADHAEARDALLAFGLEANRRLRLARLGIEPTQGGAGDERDAALVTWDATLPFALPLERALPAAVEAVVGAQAATRRALRALSQAPVARAYLAARASKHPPA